MPIRDYGVLKGRVVRRALDRQDRTPHYHLMVEAEQVAYRVAINVRSGLDGQELLHAIDDDFQNPLTERLIMVSPGFTRLPSLPNSGAVDYVRGEIVERSRFRVPPPVNRGEGGLPDLIDVYVRRMIADLSAMAYAFGTRWGPNPKETDRTFRGHPIHPSNGIHDVHMNQGNTDRPGRRDDHFFHENGPWQDGALFLHFPDQDQWIGVFLAFQNQSWQTDDRTGKPIDRHRHVTPR